MCDRWSIVRPAFLTAAWTVALAAANRELPPATNQVVLAAADQAIPPPADLLAGNLLANPGFEGAFRLHGASELVVAEGWTPWFDRGAVRPEYKDEPHVRRRPDGGYESFSFRVFHGESVQKFFTFSAVHDAGFYQRVPATPGQRLRFGVWVQVWSSDCDDPCVSPRAPCRFDSTNNHGNYRVQIGLDPDGAVPPDIGAPPPGTVQWTAPESFAAYDTWAWLAVETIARDAFVTVYTRGRPQWPVKHNDSYWDSARLEVVDPGAPTLTPAPTQATEPAPTSSTTATATSPPEPTAPPTPTPSPTPTATPSPTRPPDLRAGAFLPLALHGWVINVPDPNPAFTPRAAAAGGSGSARLGLGASRQDPSARSPGRPDDPAPPGTDLRIEFPIRAWPGQENFDLPGTCREMDFESVLIRNNGEVAVKLDGWALGDLEGNGYTFPPLTLAPRDQVRVWTRAGRDTTDGRFTDLYWGSEAPIWNNERPERPWDVARLRDDTGREVAGRGYP